MSYYNQAVVPPYLSIEIPPINHGQNDIDNLISVFHKLFNPEPLKILDFKNCNFLGPTAVAVLGGAIRFARTKGFAVLVLWNTVQEKVLANLRQNGFASTFGDSYGAWVGNSVPYREDAVDNDPTDSIIEHLTNKWLTRDWISFSENLRNEIAGRVWEIYTNAFEHSLSPVGVFSCGQHFKSKKEVVLSVVDFGNGIPNNVRAHFQETSPAYQQLRDDSCLQWAFKSGSTTTKGPPRGLGLDLLRDFVFVNRGSFEIYSGYGYALADEHGLRFSTRKTLFPGTCVQLKMICDGRRYRLSSEI